jgi:hypothetical protein
MAKGDEAQGLENGGLLKSVTSNSFIKGLLDKLFALVGIIFAAMVVSQIFAYPEFMILSDATYVEFDVPENVAKNENPLWWKQAIPVKSINISAKNYYNHLLKNYNYPIFLNYSFVDDKGATIPRIKGFKVNIDPKNRQIFADGESATVTIALEGNVSIQDYNLRIWGRGGGGESFRIGEGPLSTVKVESSGKELLHYCTITIITSVNETKKETGIKGETARALVDDRINENLKDSNKILNKKSALGDEVVI